MFKKVFLTIWHGILIAGAAFIMSSAWHWVQMMHKPRMWILGKILPVAGGLFIVFALIYITALLLSYRKNLTLYQSIKSRAPQTLFVFSFIFLSVFGKAEWQCLLAFLCFSSFVAYYFWTLSRSQILVSVWIYFVFFFCVVSLIQYFTHYYYILDLNFKFTKAIPLLRAVAVSTFWLSAVVSAFYFCKKSHKLRMFILVVLAVFWFLYAFSSSVNVGVLRGSGLFFSPTALQHAEGASNVIFTFSNIIIFTVVLLVSGLFVFLIKKIRLDSSLLSKKIIVGLWLLTVFLWAVTIKLVGVPGLQVVDTFYQHYWGEEQDITLSPQILDKLKNQFGLTYNPGEFYVNKREKVFNEPANLLPEKFLKQRPNILIIFLEAFSSKLSDVYNDTWQGKLTPGLKNFADDPNTTIFKKYYNSSTPTITGLLSLICSFLPPTGHEEIANKNRFMRFYLSCLPDILNREAGYQTISYITAVNKNYAHKDSLFESAGVKKSYGTEELKPIIKENTKAWGFSDHQMFKVLPGMLQNFESPFLVMLSTIDTHQPYDMAKDAMSFGDGKSNVLNAVYTTDDAFGKFWRWFKTSEFATNTILIAVSDHAAFPTAYLQVSQYAEQEKQGKINYYDENVFLMYVPDGKLPKVVDKPSSELDVAPTILHLLDINVSNTFDGHSIFNDREEYPNLLGMHELGLYINQIDSKGKRQELYQLPVNLAKSCDPAEVFTSTELTLCEYYQFYVWKRQMLEQGRLWMK